MFRPSALRTATADTDIELGLNVDVDVADETAAGESSQGQAVEDGSVAAAAEVAAGDLDLPPAAAQDWSADVMFPEVPSADFDGALFAEGAVGETPALDDGGGFTEGELTA